MSDDRPLVSVVTPVHNTVEYLATCIESVLGQTYEHFEYVIIENASTDGSGEIADGYAASDPRIRVVRTPELLPQVANYNFALAQIDAASAYTKMCQADDWLFPLCLEEMVATAKEHPTAGIVSSYYLRETDVLNVGVRAETTLLADGEACRRHLLDGVFLFGSPTTLLYRSDLVHARQPFFEEDRLHEDTELCFDVLDRVDMAFVHQILSFSRAQEGSIMATSTDLLPQALDRVIVTRRYGHRYLDEDEYARSERYAFHEYYRSLARRVLRTSMLRNDPGFWDHQRSGLAMAGTRLERRRLAMALAKATVEVALCPLELFRAVADLSARTNAQAGSEPG